MILNRSLREFARTLASREPVPGGGAAAGYVGALGAALAGMAIAYSRPEGAKGAPDGGILEEEAAQMEKLREELLTVTEGDCEAYGDFSKATKLPRQTPEEKASRRDKIRTALEGAMKVPLHGASLCSEGLGRLESLAGKINPRLITDVGVAAQCFGAAFRSCWYNVLINANSLKDERLSSDLLARKKRMETEVSAREKNILKKVDELLGQG